MFVASNRNVTINLCIQKKIMKEKPGKNITQSAVIKDRNYGED